jgi:AMP-binding enzyme
VRPAAQTAQDAAFPADIPPTIPAAVRRASGLWHDAEALVDAELRMTFGQLKLRVQQSAGAFIASGLEPGDRVAIWAPNGASWIVDSLGVYAAAGVLVPINTRFKAPEAAHVLTTSGAFSADGDGLSRHGLCRRAGAARPAGTRRNDRPGRARKIAFIRARCSSGTAATSSSPIRVSPPTSTGDAISPSQRDFAA